MSFSGHELQSNAHESPCSWSLDPTLRLVVRRACHAPGPLSRRHVGGLGRSAKQPSGSCRRLAFGIALRNEPERRISLALTPRPPLRLRPQQDAGAALPAGTLGSSVAPTGPDWAAAESKGQLEEAAPVSREARVDLMKRMGWSYMYGLVGAAPFLPLVAYDPGGNDLGSALIGAALGIVVGLLVRDVRAGIAPRAAVARMAVGMALGAAVWFATVAAAAALGERRYAVVSVLAVAILAVPAAAAAGSHSHRPGRGEALIETLACLAAAAAFVVLVRQILIVAPYVTLGPAARLYPEWVLERLVQSFAEHYAGSLQVGASLVLAIPGVAFVAMRLRSVGPRLAGLFADLALGISLLGWSYRLLAMLLLVFVVVATPWGARAGWASKPGRIVRLAVLVLVLLPIDVTLQGGGRYWRVMPAMSGDFTMDGLLNGPQHGYVPVGGCSSIFNEPHWFFVF